MSTCGKAIVVSLLETERTSHTGLPDDDVLALHAKYRPFLYCQLVRDLVPSTDTVILRDFFSWCSEEGVFVHPCLRIVRRLSEHRDHAFFVRDNVEALTPLLAVPEHTLIGFKDYLEDPHNVIGNSGEMTETKQARLEKEEAQKKVGSVEDVCDFFFTCLGMLASDLLVALNNSTLERRHKFALALHRGLRTLQNAPYLSGTTFDPSGVCLADVLLQMLHNYIQSGPLTGRVSRDELCWAISISLSHSTPLAIGTKKSIGIVPVLHMFPHGGSRTNAVLVTKTEDVSSSAHLQHFFHTRFGMNFAKKGSTDGMLWLVPVRDLRAGEEVCVQAMAPVCTAEDESEHMWRLSCGTKPVDNLESSQVAQLQHETTQKIIALSKAL